MTITPSYDMLDGIPQIDVAANLRAAMAAGRRATSMLKEIVQLRRGAGRLTPNEYFYYHLWDDQLQPAERACFVSKQAQHPMHMACNNTGWYAVAADKLLFQTVMSGAGLPVPTLLAVTDPARSSAGALTLQDAAQVKAFLRERSRYPLFIKPIDGKYSLSVINADGYDPHADRIHLRAAGRRPVDQVAEGLGERKAGHLIQGRLEPDQGLASMFGSALWSIRALVMMTPTGPVIHRTVAKIATGENPADNFWRDGNMLGTVDRDTGLITRVVRGAGANMAVNEFHPDTHRPLVGACIPNWPGVTGLVKAAAGVLPGIRTQSWDVALTENGPVLLEVNFGGDLNLAQLAHGTGVLDSAYVDHLRHCGYRV